MSERRHLLGAIAALTLILALPATAAEPEYSPGFADGLAGGPDYWAVANVPANDVLNVRADAGTSSDVIGALANGDVCLNRGCRMVGEQRWCRIETLGGCMTVTEAVSRRVPPVRRSNFDRRSRKRLPVTVATDSVCRRRDRTGGWPHDWGRGHDFGEAGSHVRNSAWAAALGAVSAEAGTTAG